MKRLLQSLTLVLALVLGWGAQVRANDTITIGEGTSTTYNTPYNHYYNNGWTELRYDASEVGQPGIIHGIAFNVAAAHSVTFTEFNVYMGMANSGNIAGTTGWTPASDLTLVYSATNEVHGASTGWEWVEFDTPFAYNDPTKALVVVANKVPSYSSSLTYYFTNTNGHMLYHRSDTDPTYFNHPGTASGSSSAQRANIKIDMAPMSGDFCYPVGGLTATVVDSYSAGLAWTDNHGGSSWLVQYSTTPFTPDAANATAVSTTSYSLTGLSASSMYYVAVATDCGGGSISSWATTTFTTPSDNIVTSFPWSDNFTANTGWDFCNGTQTNQWYIANGNLFVSNDQGATNAYTNTSISYTWAVRNVQFTAGDYTYSYDWKCQGEGNWDNVHAFLVPGNVTLSAGSAPGLTGSTNTCPSGWIELGAHHSGQSSWQTATGVFTIPSDGLYQLAFLWKNDGSGGSNPPPASTTSPSTSSPAPSPPASRSAT